MLSRFHYIETFGRVNGLIMQHLCLYPGMEFGSREKWWPDAGQRPTPHEGIDICCYSNDAKIHTVSSETKIPVLWQGKVAAICDDYLGRTVFIEHGEIGSNRLLGAYAHIVPEASLSPGQQVDADLLIGKVADTTGRKNRMAAHLHLSILVIPQSLDVQLLDWIFLAKTGREYLMDPLDLISMDNLRPCYDNHFLV